MIFKAHLNEGVFPEDWKEGNIVTVHKKALKTMLISYRSVSLLQMFAKKFVKIIFPIILMFQYFVENELFTVCQSGFACLSSR